MKEKISQLGESNYNRNDNCYVVTRFTQAQVKGSWHMRKALCQLYFFLQ
jgi:hypothetical protein